MDAATIQGGALTFSLDNIDFRAGNKIAGTAGVDIPADTITLPPYNG